LIYIRRSLPCCLPRFIKQSRFIQLCSFHKCQVRGAAPNVRAQLGTFIWCSLHNIVDEEFTANLGLKNPSETFTDSRLKVNSSKLAVRDSTGACSLDDEMPSEIARSRCHDFGPTQKRLPKDDIDDAEEKFQILPDL
jgi:hypothetical protein